MSDITGPPVPKAIEAVSRGTDRAAKTSRDPNQTPRQTTDDSGGNRAKSEHRETHHVRDPAVSIAASAAHLRIGEELKEHVKEIDAEGRPIIVTETATYALRPDAGLRPGDDVDLKIVDTGKQIAADLFRKNNHVIDPPIRLSLIVIAIHTPDAPTRLPDVPKEVLDAPYRPAPPKAATSALATRPAATLADAESLARLLGRGNSTQSAQAGVATKPVPSDLAPGAADNPDPFIRSNSNDLATLIAAQQSKGAPPIVTPPHAQTSQQPGLVGPDGRTTPAQTGAQTSGTHFIPPTALTDMAEAATYTPKPPVSEVGLGATIQALTQQGQAIAVQVIDPAISQVPPTEIAEVTSVSPLPSTTARTLSISAQSLGSEALAQVETNKGPFIAPLAAVNSLVGELVRITPVSGTPEGTNTSTIPTYAAKLNASGVQANQSSRPVQIQFLNAEEATLAAANTKQSHIVTTIDAVHTVRAFLTGDGPRHDLKLDTPFGTLSATLSASIRPAAGDAISILPPATPAAHSVSVVPPMPLAAEAIPAPMAGPAGWPTFEEAYALVQNIPGAADALTARSAQGGTNLLNSMVFLMAALKGGSPSGWLGRTTESAIEGRSGSLLKSLKEELSRLFTAGKDTGTEWRSLVLPFDTRSPDMPMLAALFSQVPGTIDPDSGQQGHRQDGQANDDQRFVIEVQFSVLGSIQLDGTVSRNRFNLILWSHAALPESLQGETRNLFLSALEANGFTGTIRYKNADAFPVDVASILHNQYAA